MNWKKRHRSFYYKYAEDPEDIILKASETAHLIIDVQKTYLEPKENPQENKEWHPFFDRMKNTVIPNIQSLISAKSALYFGLVAYWGVILFGTLFNI